MEYNIYIKLTNGCNLRCKHCYNEIMMNHRQMNDETLDSVVTWLKRFRKGHPEDTLNLSLHGGEPLMYDLDKILYLLKETVDLNLRWCVTTNLVYTLTDKHWKIFNQMKPFDNNCLILTSWDYKIRFRKGEQEVWENNVQQLLNNGIQVQPIICLTNLLIEKVSPNDLFNYFIDRGIKRFNFERITETGRAVENNLRPLNKNLNEWLLQTYLLYEKDKSLYIPLFEGVEKSLEKVYLGCRARKCMERVITINPDGSLSACPNMANKTYGSLNVIDECKKCKLIEFEQQHDTRCYMCPYFEYCNGDCCQLRWDETGCPGMNKIYKYLLNKGK